VRRSMVRLLAPVLAILLPFALLVGLGVNYMSLVRANRERNLQGKARLLLKGMEADLAARVEDLAARALDILAPPLAGEGRKRSFSELFAKDLAPQAEALEGVAGVFLLEGGKLVYPDLPRQVILGAKGAEFPFEYLEDPVAQDAWDRLSGLVDDYLRTLSFDWALEEIQKARKNPSVKDPDFPYYLDYLEATIWMARKEKAKARKAFLALAEKLSRRIPRPGRETLLCRYEAARLAPREVRTRELLDLARGIAGGEWDDVPEKFLQFILEDRIFSDLSREEDQEVKNELENTIKPMEAAREARRAFALSMKFLGKVLVLSELKRQALPEEEPHYLDMEGPDGPLVLAFRAIAGRPGTVEGAALSLPFLAKDILSRSDSADLEGEEALAVSMRTPRNQPVLPPPPGKGTAAPDGPPPLAALDLGPPLQGFRLLARLKDPAEARRREAMDRWKLGVYLAALTLMAGTGAFFLARNVRREVELARMKADFVSRVTHDLKTPLSLIRLYAETLVMGRAAAQGGQEKCGSVILSECDRLNTMVDQILDFSHMDRGRFTYRPARTRLGRLVREAVEAFRPKAVEGGVDLSWNLEEDPPVHLDEEGFRRCLLNLLDNAVKFGGKDVEVVLGSRNGEISLEVRDRGPGIPPGEREKVFRPFYRGKTAGEKRGSGLGLSLVHHFVISHGGAIRILDREGGGTVFRITFPPPPPQEEPSPRKEARE